MGTFLGIPEFSNALWVAMETKHFHKAHTKNVLRTPLYRIQGVPIYNLAPMKTCHVGAR